ncbi:hypothetical protein PYW07_003233 [Mythimna separata]|uniref:Ubiquinone biosynthesis O-methyltransferase, mitochondrial n=1 Tax=Mythimna separata TaxID=271217 RepID=A0AAD8DR24_MYTSE|nr:hypothetical protein PYW07_003233 [Mythimna separata]
MWARKLSRCVLDNTVYYRNATLKLPQCGILMSTQPSKMKEAKMETQSSSLIPTANTSTIDAADVDFFSKQMNEWWDPDGKMFLLHSMNMIRIPFIRDGLISTAQKELHPLKGKKILDVGCGGGILSEGLARLGASVTGIDASKELIRVAEKHKNVDPKIANNRPEYINCTIEDHARMVENHYDAVVASEVIEHVNNQELFVKSCIKTVRPRGKLFFTTPNRTRLSQFVVIFLAENVIKAIPNGAHQYEKFITPNELTFLLERNNCHVELTYGVTYNPITKRWDFTQYQDLMYAIQASKLN